MGVARAVAPVQVEKEEMVAHGVGPVEPEACQPDPE
jgi:hypothetical protein